MARLLATILLCLTIALPAWAESGSKAFDYERFASLPVQHQGRIKPIDTFARVFLYNFSGQEKLNGQSAEAWLAQTLFDPAQAMQERIFRVPRPALPGLPPRGEPYYSYAELAGALQSKADTLRTIMTQDDRTWNGDQRELVRLQEMSILYAQLLRSFSFALPLNTIVPQALAKEWKLDPKKAFTAEDYRPYRKRLEDRLSAIIARKGHDPARYTKQEQDIAAFAFQMQSLEQAGQDNILLRVIPGQAGGFEGEWFSPWALMENGQASPANAAFLEAWTRMAKAYAAGDEQGWENAVKEASSLYPASKNPGYEIAYNRYKPLSWALVFYLASLSLLGGFFLTRARWMKGASLALLGAGAAANGAAIVLRVLILSRPPVGTLYESILFVACICAAVSLVLERTRKDGTGLMAGSVSGLALLLIAQGFAEDDTMGVLVAVLNTNFWLATHVLCITAGYGLCLITAFMAHVWLARRAMGREAERLERPVRTLCLISLLLTVTGTVLGGIWADQSWGRFWGWDPKENGALLIVLWLIWILHGSLSGHLKGAAFMAGTAALAVIVMLAWFGVNLLSVGLHSYGFVSGIALALAVYCTIDLALIAGLWLAGARRNRA